nr:MAG TPA: hypothetical protein [Caudoviricetes sp.]
MKNQGFREKFLYADNAIIGNAKKSIEEINKKCIVFYGI